MGRKKMLPKWGPKKISEWLSSIGGPTAMVTKIHEARGMARLGDDDIRKGIVRWNNAQKKAQKKALAASASGSQQAIAKSNFNPVAATKDPVGGDVKTAPVVDRTGVLDSRALASPNLSPSQSLASRDHTVPLSGVNPANYSNSPGSMSYPANSPSIMLFNNGLWGQASR